MLRWNKPPAPLAECLGSFTCHCGNTGVEWTLNKSQHTKLTLEKKILLLLLLRALDVGELECVDKRKSATEMSTVFGLIVLLLQNTIEKLTLHTRN